jgi:putative membrane protein insertion efficiency factor
VSALAATWRTRVALMPRKAVILLIRGYRVLISPLFPPSCRFTPTCSSYALTSVERYGAIRGGWLAAKRIGRCHPWNPGGYDPVP